MGGFHQQKVHDHCARHYISRLFRIMRFHVYELGRHSSPFYRFLMPEYGTTSIPCARSRHDTDSGCAVFIIRFASCMDGGAHPDGGIYCLGNGNGQS